jgi:hypothetical protein
MTKYRATAGNAMRKKAASELPRGEGEREEWSQVRRKRRAGTR